MEAQALQHERRMKAAQGDKEALEHAIAAAELYMKAASAAKTAEDRRRLGRKCKELIELGERLKARTKGTTPDAVAQRSVPESARPLTTAEKTIILKASRLHGHVFPPWDSAPTPEIFLDTDGTPYADPAPFSLSAEQKAMVAGWLRPTELMSVAGEPDEVLEQLMTAQAELDLAQDLATDCSVVASLCAAARHFGPTKDSLLAPLMYPFDHKAMQPQLSKSGKYVFRMYFNGSWRRVTIDDRLPASKTDRTLYAVDRRNPRLIWPALVEKAYLKIRGGYDFPGSNSGTDLHALTGWIPEQIFLQSDEIELDETWNRIKAAYDERNAILTLGTGNILPEEEKALGLVREHDYAVMDLKEEEGARLLLVKNPWIDSLVWTGVGSSATLKAHTAGSPKEGTSNQFWMAFEDVLQHFDSLYVNWNPALFSHRQDHHFRWEMPDKTEELVFTHNPQYTVLATSRKPIWILLSRHWQDGELDILRQRRAEKDHGEDTGGGGGHDSSLATVSKQLGFMSLAIYATSPPGTRVPLPDMSRRLHHHPLVDSPNILLRYQPTPGVAQTLVVTQSELPLPTYTFTLSFFSHEPLTVAPAPPPLPHSLSVRGAWTRRTAGGSPAHPTYYTNPQYSLTLPQPSPVTLVLSTSTHDLPVHIALAFPPRTPSCSSSPSSPPSPQQRITSLSGRDILAASPEYQHGGTAASAPRLDAGTYNVILSTFEPGQLGDYTLRVSAAVPPRLEPIPADAAGMLRTPVPVGTQPIPPGTLTSSSSTTRFLAPVALTRQTRLSAIAATSPTPTSSPSASFSLPGTHPSIRLSLSLGRPGPHATILATAPRSGDFVDLAAPTTNAGSALFKGVPPAAGLRTGETDVHPDLARAGGLWVVLEMRGGGRLESGGGGDGGVGPQGVAVEVLSDGLVKIGGWEVEEGG
ncbi:hypothetical protein VTJ83DRAFT_943 [Remersonia thermophila]|uniref:Calpain catalytic domain-containing protein n=1 Tax=Remersonia thermophila TaxID=72144 RepID=A0ABR4DMX0_9PEZI